MKRSKGMQLGAMLAAVLVVSLIFMPAVSAQGKENTSKDERLKEILKQLPPNPNRPEPKYLIDAEDMASVDELEKKMTDEEAKQILSKISELKPGEERLLTHEQSAAAQKIMNKEVNRKLPSPSGCSSSSVESVLTTTIACNSTSTDYYRHAFIATNNKYVGANNIMSGYLPILTNTTYHHTLMALWFVDRGVNPWQWAELGMRRYTNSGNIYTYLYDSDEGGYHGPYQAVGSGTQVYFEIIVLSGNTYIAWIGNTVYDLGLHVTTTYNEVDMGGEQYDSNKQFAIGDIGNVYQPQLLTSNGYIYWGGSVPTNPNNVWCPMQMDLWDTSQGYRVHVYSKN